MAVSVRIEDEAFSDRRYDVLARMLGIPDADCARGKMAAVWRQCTQQQTHILSGEMVREILGENGPDALIKSELGAPVEAGIRICGTRGRIEWLAKLRKNSRKGGLARQAKRLPKGKPTGITDGDPDTSPPAPAPAPAPAQEKESGSLPLALVPPTSEPKRIPAKSHPDQQRVIAAFHDRYKASYGSKPTWIDKTIGQVGNLLKRHTAETLIARMDFMFAGKAKWPPGPYSLDVFVANIDRWVDASPVSSTPLRKLEEL